MKGGPLRYTCKMSFFHTVVQFSHNARRNCKCFLVEIHFVIRARNLVFFLRSGWRRGNTEIVSYFCEPVGWGEHVHLSFQSARHFVDAHARARISFARLFKMWNWCLSISQWVCPRSEIDKKKAPLRSKLAQRKVWQTHRTRPRNSCQNGDRFTVKQMTGYNDILVRNKTFWHPAI